MAVESDEFLRSLLATFKVEAQEHVHAIFAGLVELERGSPDDTATVETIFRAAHSLKGAARAVNAANIEGLCQKLEGAFSALKRRELELSPALLDSLHADLDSIRGLLQALAGSPTQAAAEGSVQAIVGEPNTRATGSASRKMEESELPETVRIATGRLDSLLLRAEELVLAKIALAQHAGTIARLHDALQQWQKRWSAMRRELPAVPSQRIRVASSSSNPSGFVEFLDWNDVFLKSFEQEFAALHKPFERDRRAFGLRLDGLLEEMKQVVMLPFSSLRDLLLKVVRDIAREQGKEVDFLFEGADIEVDRRILDEMKDPLIHLVRNSIDHGIEKAEERQARHKPARGSVKLSIHRERSAKLELRISDDGKGVDLERLKAVAVQSGVVSSIDAERLSEAAALDLLFGSGLSTSAKLTSISGRGLGLAIVREKVEKLGGSIAVKSVPGEGTEFTMSVPLSVSTFRGITVSAAGQTFVIPTSHIRALVRFKWDSIKTATNQPTISLGEHLLALFKLEEVLGITRSDSAPPSSTGLAVVVEFAGELMALSVDEVQQEQEVLLKKLGKQLVRVKNLAGATILGAGRVVPVLNVADLMKSAGRSHRSTPPLEAEAKQAGRKKILVVDDSITTRTLIRNILQSNGYAVETAVDGADGLMKAGTGQFSLVVSDVEMPRMNGLDLTARIRADKRLVDLPVILVTALESQEDRERGIDVGANAYIVKRSFDQSNLLEAVRRLI